MNFKTADVFRAEDLLSRSWGPVEAEHRTVARLSVVLVLIPRPHSASRG